MIDPIMLVSPLPIKKHGRMTISYNGQLAISRNNKLFVHYGYGTNMQWNNVEQQEMNVSPKGFTTTITVKGENRINLCFHDIQGHWDNNEGNNWSFEIQ